MTDPDEVVAALRGTEARHALGCRGVATDFDMNCDCDADTLLAKFAAAADLIVTLRDERDEAMRGEGVWGRADAEAEK